jgi:hypothetical protein
MQTMDLDSVLFQIVPQTQIVLPGHTLTIVNAFLLLFSQVH